MESLTEPILTFEKFETLLRNSGSEMSTYLEEVEVNFKIDGTEAHTTCHFLKLNGSGQVRFADFALFLANKIIDFAIPRSELDIALEFHSSTGSTSKIVALHRKAQSLFASLKKSGEGGEVLLYLLIEEILKVPQILCKMNLKTDNQMYVHGCDGIHAKYDDDSGQLSFYWGESKLYQNLNDGIKACVTSVKDFLLHAEGDITSQDRDIQLVRSYIDLNDDGLEDAIVNFLDKDNENYNKVIYKAACLVGFDYNQYPKSSNTGVTLASIKEEIQKEIESWRKKIKETVEDVTDLKGFEINIFLLPFPSVQSFRDSFLGHLGIKRENETS